MPIKIDIYDFKCFNQLRNGATFVSNLSEFTPNLVGNMGEIVKVEFKANISQSAYTEGVEEWFIDTANNEIVRASGSFFDDNVQVGDQFEFFADWQNRKNTSSEYTGTVTFLSGDGRTLKYSVDSGSDVTNGTQTNVGLTFDQQAAANRNTALFLKFGLLENEETFNYQSKTTEAAQVYYKGELAIGVPTSAESLGTIKDWVSGGVTFEAIAGDPDFKSAQFVVSHTFVLNPFYILAYRSFIDAGTIPDILAADNSLKYAAELEFRKTLTNTGSSKAQSFDDLEGFTGWYGENFNGLNTKYEVVSVAYEDDATGDPLEGININVDTKVTITVNDTGGAITDYSCGVYLARVPTSESQYIGTKTDLISNFLFKSEVVSSPATSSGNVTTSLVGGDLVIEYVVSYTTAQKLQLTEEDEFLLLVQVEDPTISAGNSDRTMLLAAFQNYVDVDYLAEFISVSSYAFLQHTQNLTDDTGQASPVVANEDGILLNGIIGTNIARNVIINGLTVKLLAYNPITEEYFELDSYAFDINSVISGGVQQIEVDTERGYPLNPGDEFNFVKVTTEGVNAGFQEYAILLGQKIKWQEWILNPNVDDVFFDAAEPNNNLNFKSSNYSDKEDYKIKLASIINVTGVDDLGRSLTGDYIYLGGDLTTLDYDESDDGVSGFIETFDVDTGNSLAGNILYNGKDTLFKAVFSDAGSMQYAIHRIEPSQNPGDGILELSSEIEPVTPGLLKPIEGETKLKFNLVGSTLTTECLIDGSKIQEGVSYKLSARTSYVLSNAFEFTVDTTKAGTASDKFQLPLISGGTYNMFVDKGNGDALVPITVWNQAETLLDYSGTGSGIYTVKIYGVCTGWRFANGGDKLKIIDIAKWGTLNVGNSQGYFNGCANLSISATDVLDLTGTTDFTDFFNGCAAMDSTNLDSWDVSAVTIMRRTFQGCTTFNKTLNSWVVSNVTITEQMFKNCQAFNQSLNSWDVSAVTNPAGMFDDCYVFNGNITSWQLSSATRTDSMFRNCFDFNQPIDSWAPYLTNVTAMQVMFRFCQDFNQSLNSWDVSAVTNMEQMFYRCDSFNGNITSWDVSAVTNMRYMFEGCNVFNQAIGVWTTTSLTDIFHVLKDCPAFNKSLDNWDVSAVTNMEESFSGCTVLNQPFSSWDTSLVTNMAGTFKNCPAFNGNITSWNTSACLRIDSMFDGCTAFDQNINTSGGAWVTSNITRIDNCFKDCINFNQDISGWDTGAITNMNSAFSTATSFDQDLGAWDVTALTTATGMFANVTLSTANYDALLVGWEGQAVNNNVVFSGGNSTYTSAGAGGTARAALIADHSWTITDGGGV